MKRYKEFIDNIRNQDLIPKILIFESSVGNKLLIFLDLTKKWGVDPKIIHKYRCKVTS